MTKVLQDACVPHLLRLALQDFDVETAQFAGLDELPDKALLDAIAGRYDVLITLERGLIEQQQLAGRPFGVILLRTKEQTPQAF